MTEDFYFMYVYIPVSVCVCFSLCAQCVAVGRMYDTRVLLKIAGPR